MVEPASSAVTGMPQKVRQFVAASNLYQMLAIFLRTPSRELVSGIMSGAVSDTVLQLIDEAGLMKPSCVVIKAALDSLSQHTQEDGISLSKLRHAYTTLFSHPAKPEIAIYESLFLFWEKNPQGRLDEAPRLFVSPAALDAERCYRKAGYARSPERNEPADNMATELEFMYNLYASKADALAEGDQKKEGLADDCIEEFTRIHLRKWVVRFFDRCADVARHPFYHTVGLVGSAFVEEYGNL